MSRIFSFLGCTILVLVLVVFLKIANPDVNTTITVLMLFAYDTFHRSTDKGSKPVNPTLAPFSLTCMH